MSKWWVKSGDSATGPFTPKAIAKSVRGGRLKRDALVRASLDEPWVPLDSVEALAAAIAAPAKKKLLRDERAGDDSDRRIPYSYGVYVAAILLTGVAMLARIGFVMVTVAAMSLDSHSANLRVSVAVWGTSVLLYLWAILGMTAHKESSYKLAILLHGFGMVGSVLSCIYAKRFDEVSEGIIAIALVAFVVTYRARHGFYER